MTHVVVDTSAWMRRRQPQVGEALAGAVEEDKVALTTAERLARGGLR